MFSNYSHRNVLLSGTKNLNGFFKKKLFTLYQQIRKQFEWKYHLGSFTLMKFSQYMVNISEKKMTENFHSIDMHFKHIMKMKLALIAYSILERFFSLCEHCLYGLIFPPVSFHTLFDALKHVTVLAIRFGTTKSISCI